MAQPLDGVAVRRSGVHGHGVFATRATRATSATRALLAGEEIGRYAGRRYAPDDVPGEWDDRLTYLFGLSGGSTIDGAQGGMRTSSQGRRKGRYAMLPPVLLERLRVWWRVGRAQGKILRNDWPFPGLDPMDPLRTRQLNRAIHAAADAASFAVLRTR